MFSCLQFSGVEKGWQGLIRHALDVFLDTNTDTPNQQRTLDKLPPELRRRSFVDKHRLSMRIGRPSVQKACVRRVRIPTELPFLRAAVAGWAHRRDEEEKLSSNFFRVGKSQENIFPPFLIGGRTITSTPFFSLSSKYFSELAKCKNERLIS